ncbi:hypothetical protein BO86DRAFT_393374, partial [Aspergillus japonicus CBS 114.51]
MDYPFHSRKMTSGFLQLHVIQPQILRLSLIAALTTGRNKCSRYKSRIVLFDSDHAITDRCLKTPSEASLLTIDSLLNVPTLCCLAIVLISTLDLSWMDLVL